MSNELAAKLTWTFFREVAVPNEIQDTLMPGEIAQTAFKTFRDAAVFTNKRLIVRDSQGITGKKVEQYSLPWSSVNMWSSENAGHLDLDSEIELWTRAGHVSIELKRGADVRRLDNLIAEHVLGPSAVVIDQQNTMSAPASPPQQPQQEPRGGRFGGMFGR